MHSRPYAQHSKVQLFWDSYKNLRNRPHGFDIYLGNIKTMRMIAQIFVAFSEKLNFSFCASQWGARPTQRDIVAWLILAYSYMAT